MVRWLKLENIKAYVISSELADFVWNLVLKWDWFNKRTLGVQWVNSTDSISANIAEGFGRFHKKDKQKFYYNARGSVYESAHWCKRAIKRNLINENQEKYFMSEIRKLPREINYLISITERKLKK
jgi:four helix bundle protein